MLTFLATVSSADSIRTQFVHMYPDRAQHNVGPDLGPNCLTL